MTPSEIKSIRNWLGLSQRALADFIGVDYRTVQRWEAGNWEIPGPVRMLMTILYSGKIPKPPEKKRR